VGHGRNHNILVVSQITYVRVNSVQFRDARINVLSASNSGRRNSN